MTEKPSHRPTDAADLVELLRQRARHQGDRLAYAFLPGGEGEPVRMTYGELDARARALAARLQGLAKPGARALLVYPPGLPYIAAFFGCLYAGVAAVPVYPPRSNSPDPRFARILTDSRARLVLTTAALHPIAERLLAGTTQITAVATDSLSLELAEGWQAPELGAGTLAFLQYTSGSTSAPKGVMVRHGDLTHNEAMIQEAFGVTADSVVVGWLPLYHDMGLIGNVLQCLWAGCPAYLMSPLDFLQKPLRWLAAVSRFGATVSGGPNFAYDLAARKVGAEEKRQLDLSSWRVAFNGAEPVRAATLERFARAFEPCGFRPQAFFPCYGLAEATLFVTGASPGEGARTRSFDADELAGNRARAAAEEEGARHLVSSGRASAGLELAIVDPESGRSLPEGQVGEIWIRGSSVAGGYWNRPELSEETFEATLAEGGGPYLRTGDLGFVDGGELFVTGRLKDLIIIRGQNHYPQDIELTVETSHPGLRPGCGAAFAVEADGEERLVVVQEVRRDFREPDPTAVVETIRREVAEAHGIQVHAAALIRAATLPKTSSGKVRRAATRKAFLAGELEVLTAWELPALPAEEAEGTDLGEPSVAGAMATSRGPEADEERIRRWLVAEVAVRAGVAREAVDPSRPLSHWALDSLAAMELAHAVESRLHLPLSMETFFEEVSIAELAARLAGRRESAAAAVEATASPAALPAPGAAAREHPLSHNQRALWFLYLLEPTSAAYNVPGAVRVEGPVDTGALRRSIETLIERHTGLRSTFNAPHGEPVQRIASGAEVEFGKTSAADWSEEELAERLAAEANRPFDLERGPLLRAHLFVRSAHEHIVLLTMHHIVTDFWSQGLLLKELDLLYPAERAGRSAQLPPLSLTYADFVRWQEEMLAGEEGERLAAYWRGKLAGDLPVLALPTDHPRPPVQTYSGATVKSRIAPAVATRLHALARQGGATLFMALAAAFKVLLYRYTGQTDLLVGVPTTGRSHAGLASLVGYFVNPVVLRSRLGASSGFRELLERLRATAVEAFEHQDYPFPSLVEELQPVRDPSRSPLFQVMFALQKAPQLAGQDLSAFALGEEGVPLVVGGLHLTSVALPERIAQFDLTLTVGELDEGLVAAFNYNTDLFDSETVERMARHFENLLTALADDCEQPIGDLPLLSEAERHRILERWNHTRAYYPTRVGLHQLIEEQAAETPEAPAVIFGDGQLSYRELDERADRVAHYLARRGAGPEELVGICVHRSLELMVGILGILKTGAAYLPLDPDYPAERLEYMLGDAGARLLLTQESLGAAMPAGAEVVRLDADWGAIAGEEDGHLSFAGGGDTAACVIYTSGSTGKPKGVVLTHRNVANLTSSFIRSYSPAAEDRILPLTSIASASFVGEIFPLLAAGGALVLPDQEQVLDSTKLIALIAHRHVSILSTVPSLIAVLNAMKDELPKLRLILSGGESLVAGDVDRILESATIINGYGLTETTICSTYYRVTMADLASGESLPIGRPLMNQQLYVLDDRLHPLPAGCPGKLTISGDGLARGYLANPRLTAERFLPNPFRPGARMYATGDLARWRPDGNLEFLGRLDQQVKLRGFRIELGEIETVLGQHPGVSVAVAIAREDEPGERQIVAYTVPDAGEPPTTSELLTYLRGTLPEYMVPAAFVFLDRLPLTPNGKVDVKALPAPGGLRPDLETTYTPPTSERERIIAALWQEALGVEKVGIHDNFFDLGGHSLLLAKVHARLREALAREISLVELFRNPTVSSLAKALSEEGRPAVERRPAASTTAPAAGAQAGGGAIAVVGLAGRWPGARNPEQLWDNLAHGREGISFFSDEELLAAGVDPERVAHPDYVKAKGILGDVDLFDAGLFGLSPREVELMDPQHRIFLECCWEALERAGYNAGHPAQRVGVFGGESMNTYLITNLLSHLELVASADTLQASLGNDKDPLTSRVSYKLNLNGPSITIQSASSTSLVAVHVAVRSLLEDDCDMALAGGVSIHLPEVSGYMFEEGGTTSPDGHCRAFDAAGQGFVAGHGCGVVVLKRLEKALADGDHIHAVIKGSACNNDGSVKVSYTAPSVEGQVEVYHRAYANAGITPDSLTYIEGHGTATAMGDPIEIAALTQAFRAYTDRETFCAIGSLKTNIGHLDTAAGVCGLIKAVLALEHRQIPPSLHFQRPNPRIDFASSPFFVNTELRDWETHGTPRRAGVTSLGMGGTNAHVILEEAPQQEPSGPARPAQLLLLSAATATALEAATGNLAADLEAHPLRNLADVAYTLKVGRRAFPHRRALVCRDPGDAAAALAALDPERILSGEAAGGSRPVAFLFSGQGSQYPGMARGLYAVEPTFRAAIDRCAELLEPELGLDLRSLLFPAESAGEEAARRLEQTELAQPALFTVEYALATLWMEWGVRPQAMLGHSIGEYVAACLAGVFSLRDALRLVAARGRMMQRLPGGAMAAVPLPEEGVLPLLGDELSLAAVNRPNLCVVSGPAEAVESFCARLAERGMDSRRLHTSHAFHSRMMDPILELFTERVRRVKLKAPRIPYLSNVTGTWVLSEQATDPEYWAAHIRRPVRFAAGIAELLREPSRLLLEVGPGNALTTLARQHPDRSPTQLALASLRHPREQDDDLGFLLTTLARLWLAGADVDWRGFYAHQRRRRVPAPTYPFERQRYWIEPRKDAAGHRRAAGRRRHVPAEWFYQPVWRQAAAQPAAGVEGGDPSPCLLFVDEVGVGEEVARQLAAQGRQVVTVRAGETFQHTGDGTYRLAPADPEHYAALLEDLAGRGCSPGVAIHLWNVTAAQARGPALDEVDRQLDTAFWSLLALAQALGKRPSAEPLHLLVVANGLHEVTGEEIVEPAKATLLGPCRVLPKEVPSLACRSLDVVLPGNGSVTAGLGDLARRILAELAVAGDEPVVALRGKHRWLQGFEAVPLAEPGPEAGRLRQGGVYLVTGGLGGLGLEIAAYLARTAEARLVLVSRSGLPERGEWEGWLAAHGEDDATGRRIRRVAELEEAGAQVLVAAADVADRPAMERVRQAALERFGAVHGIIHAAGRPGGGIVQVKTREAAEEVLRPKVHGTRVLHQVFGAMELDFLTLFSSVTAVLAQPGQVDYVAANAFLDAFAHAAAGGAFPTVALGWDAWREVGMAVDTEVPPELAEWRRQELKQGLGNAEGVEAFRRALAASVPRLLISTRDLAIRVEENRAARTLEQLERAEEAPAHPRPLLANAYVAPRSEKERQVAAVWQELLGIDQVGVHDNFFDLGGNSLMAIRIISRLKSDLAADVSEVSLFERPTVAALAEMLEGGDGGGGETAVAESGKSRGERRRAARQRRRG